MAGEADTIARIVDLLRAQQGRLRGQHAKSHGCVSATLVVDAVPADLAYGIFAQPAVYPAWVRFSSSSPIPRSDVKADAHGMAIKVLLPDEQAQDFVLATGDAFFCANPNDYLELLAADRLLAFFFNRRHLRIRAFRNLRRAIGTRLINPLAGHYHSQTPYELGPHAVKYTAIPPPDEVFVHADGSPDGLRDAMAMQLAIGRASFDLKVQRQGQRMPVEDPTVRWNTPLRTVATIRIGRQDFSTAARRDFAENLSFSPAHALPAHRPVGGINRVREAVYGELSALRREINERGP